MSQIWKNFKIMIGWLFKALQWGGPAALGYFFNDVATWISNVTGLGEKVRDQKTGGFAWWFVIVLSLILGLVVYVVASFLMPRRKGMRFFIGILGLISFAYDMHAGTGLVVAQLLGSIPASSSGVIRSNYCPEYIIFNIATVPTSFRIDVSGDGVVFSLDGTGITNLNGVRQVGALPANQYIFQISDGYIKKNTTLSITNAAVAQLDVYGFSDSMGTLYNLHLMAQAFQNQTYTFDNFFYAATPSAGATDLYTITFADGTTDVLTRIELETYLAYRQQVVTTRYNIDNFNQSVKYVQFLPLAASQNVYWMRANAAQGVISQSM